MDRLLTDEERPKLPPNSISIYAPTLLDKIKELEYKIAKAQDSKTAHLVAQEIIKDLNKYRFAEPQYIAEAGREPVIICLTENDMLAIKSKWGIE